jgi:hypothetical protein
MENETHSSQVSKGNVQVQPVQTKPQNLQNSKGNAQVQPAQTKPQNLQTSSSTERVVIPPKRIDIVQEEREFVFDSGIKLGEDNKRSETLKRAAEHDAKYIDDGEFDSGDLDVGDLDFDDGDFDDGDSASDVKVDEIPKYRVVEKKKDSQTVGVPSVKEFQQRKPPVRKLARSRARNPPVKEQPQQKDSSSNQDLVNQLIKINEQQNQQISKLTKTVEDLESTVRDLISEAQVITKKNRVVDDRAPRRGVLTYDEFASKYGEEIENHRKKEESKKTDGEEIVQRGRGYSGHMIASMEVSSDGKQTTVANTFNNIPIERLVEITGLVGNYLQKMCH